MGMQEKVKLDEFEPVSVRVPENLLKKGPVFKVTRTVENSDMDENFHMNQSNYLKWCMDSFAQYKNSCSERKFYDILSDYSKLKLIDMQHVQEARIYQKCDIYIFNDENDEFYFQFNKSGDEITKKPLFIGKICF